MAPKVGSENNQPTAFDADYLKNAKVKENMNYEEQKATKSLFENLWNVAANMSYEADADGNGVVDEVDLPLLTRLVQNLSLAQQKITNGFEITSEKYKERATKINLDIEKYRENFKDFEQRLRTFIAQISDPNKNGTYVSPKQIQEKSAAEAAKAAEKAAAEAAKAKENVSSLEPTTTDADRRKKNGFSELISLANSHAKIAGAGGKDDGHGIYAPVELSDINAMYSHLLGITGMDKREKVKIFSTWLLLHKNDMRDSEKTVGLKALDGLIRDAENHEFLNEQIAKAKNPSKFLDNVENQTAYLKVMKDVIYNTGLTLNKALEVVNPK